MTLTIVFWIVFGYCVWVKKKGSGLNLRAGYCVELNKDDDGNGFGGERNLRFLYCLLMMLLEFRR
jgi:hypothetical protein